MCAFIVKAPISPLPTAAQQEGIAKFAVMGERGILH